MFAVWWFCKISQSTFLTEELKVVATVIIRTNRIIFVLVRVKYLSRLTGNSNEDILSADVKYNWGFKIELGYVKNSEQIGLPRGHKTYGSSHGRYSFKICVLRNFAKFIGKHLCQSLFFSKVAGLRPATLFKK